MADRRTSYQAEYYELDQLLDRLRRLPEVCKAAAQDVARECMVLIESNIAAGVDPYGHPWIATQDGHQPLKNAAKAVSVAARGTKIEFNVTGPEYLHHVGKARGYHGGSARLGGFRRALIPWKTEALPGPFKAVCRETLKKHCDQIMQKD